MTAVVAGGTTAAAAYFFTDTKFSLYGMMLPVVRVFDPETSHYLTIQAAKNGVLPSDTRKDDTRLNVHLWGRKFSNPIGVAAGFDKDAEAMDGVLNMGVGFMEVGNPHLSTLFFVPILKNLKQRPEHLSSYRCMYFK
jgi:dihydroorotate dehydrogenase